MSSTMGAPRLGVLACVHMLNFRNRPIPRIALAALTIRPTASRRDRVRYRRQLHRWIAQTALADMSFVGATTRYSLNRKFLRLALGLGVTGRTLASGIHAPLFFRVDSEL